jgi:4'-phosphopantetheinyl transferase
LDAGRATLACAGTSAGTARTSAYATWWLEQTLADLPAADDWLGAAEAVRLSGMRFPKRRADWRLGRWTAKHAVSFYLKLPVDPSSLARVEIRAAPSGAPEAFLGNEPAPVTISISHREGRAACAIAGSPAMLGCDLEIAEPRSDAFATDYFTAEEQDLVAQATEADRWRLLALLWSAKESALKALGEGLRLDTRSVAVDLQPHSSAVVWQPLRAEYDGRVFDGWWRQTDNLVRTMVAAPAPAPPLTYQT